MEKESFFQIKELQKLRKLFAMELFKKTGNITTVATGLGITLVEAEKIVRDIGHNGVFYEESISSLSFMQDKLL